tara:strand:- start:1075 stop:1431 length:357 start_codon:yes stop_codon:yes gene_type:complete
MLSLPAYRLFEYISLDAFINAFMDVATTITIIPSRILSIYSNTGIISFKLYIIIKGGRYESLLNNPFSKSISSKSVEVFLKKCDIDLITIYLVTIYTMRLSARIVKYILSSFEDIAMI